MSFPCSFSSSSLLTLPGAFFRAMARAFSMVIFGFVVLVAANDTVDNATAAMNAAIDFCFMRSPFMHERRLPRARLHKREMNADGRARATYISALLANDERVRDAGRVSSRA